MIKLARKNFFWHHTCETCGEYIPAKADGFMDDDEWREGRGYYCQFCGDAMVAAGAAKVVRDLNNVIDNA